MEVTPYYVLHTDNKVVYVIDDGPPPKKLCTRTDKATPPINIIGQGHCDLTTLPPEIIEHISNFCESLNDVFMLSQASPTIRKTLNTHVQRRKLSEARHLNIPFCPDRFLTMVKHFKRREQLTLPAAKMFEGMHHVLRTAPPQQPFTRMGIWAYVPVFLTQEYGIEAAPYFQITDEMGLSPIRFRSESHVEFLRQLTPATDYTPHLSCLLLSELDTGTRRTRAAIFWDIITRLGNLISSIWEGQHCHFKLSVFLPEGPDKNTPVILQTTTSFLSGCTIVFQIRPDRMDPHRIENGDMLKVCVFSHF